MTVLMKPYRLYLKKFTMVAALFRSLADAYKFGVISIVKDKIQALSGWTKNSSPGEKYRLAVWSTICGTMSAGCANRYTITRTPGKLNAGTNAAGFFQATIKERKI